MARLTATEALEMRIAQSPPSWVRTQEDHHKWCLSEIQKAAQALAQPHIDALVNIEKNKPPKPIILTAEQMDALGGLIPPVNE